MGTRDISTHTSHSGMTTHDRQRIYGVFTLMTFATAGAVAYAVSAPPRYRRSTATDRHDSRHQSQVYA